MVDVAIAIVLALLAGVMAYLGVHSTLHPPLTDNIRRIYKILFIGLALASAGLIGVQAYHNRRTQAQLQSQLNKIQKNTEQPPIVNVTVPPPTVIAENPTLGQKVANLEAQSANQEKRQKLINKLASLSNEGVEIRNNFLTETSEQDILRAKTEWEMRVELYLTQQFGESYVVRFRNPGESPLVYPSNLRHSLLNQWADTERKIEMLGTFLEKVAN